MERRGLLKDARFYTSRLKDAFAHEAEKRCTRRSFHLPRVDVYVSKVWRQIIDVIVVRLEPPAK